MGSAARFAVPVAIARGTNEVFPWGTLAANVSGCFIIGLFAMLTGPDGRIWLMYWASLSPAVSAANSGDSRTPSQYAVDRG